MPKTINCPNCTEPAEVTAENEVFCQKCNITIKIIEGKAKIESKGRIQVLEENLAYLQEDYRKFKKVIVGDEEDALDL